MEHALIGYLSGSVFQHQPITLYFATPMAAGTNQPIYYYRGHITQSKAVGKSRPACRYGKLRSSSCSNKAADDGRSGHQSRNQPQKGAKALLFSSGRQPSHLETADPTGQLLRRAVEITTGLQHFQTAPLPPPLGC